MQVLGDPVTSIGGLAFDVRDVCPGDLFAALDGDPFRGHDVAGEAVIRGAAAVLLARDLALDAPMLLAPRPRSSLARIAAAFHGHPSRSLGVIGITGTDGKTTTAHLLDSILRTAGCVTGSITTIEVRIGGEARPAGNRLTTPESPVVQGYLREMVDTGARFAIVEATSHGLVLNRLDEIDFAVAAVTNVTHEHLDFHRSAAGYRRAKARLFELAGPSGKAVVNGDDEGARELLPFATGSRVLLYGRDPAADVRMLDVELRPEGSSFLLAGPDLDPVPVRLPLPGRFNVSNALCAATCALACEVDAETIARGLASASPVPGRMTPIESGQPFAVVVDFAHTPNALRQVIELLRASHGGRVIAVLGSAGERDILKRPLLGEAAATGADLSVFTSEDPRFEDPEAVLAQIAAGALAAGGREHETFVCITDRREAVLHALSRARAGDCVLLAGKGHERSIVWGAEERPWDEAAVAREALAELGWVAR